MNEFRQVPGWLTDPSHWSGADGIPERVVQHLELSFIAILLALLLAVPVGLWVGHRHRFEFAAVTAANAGRAVPSFALLVVVFILMLHVWPAIAFGPGPTVVVLTLLAIPSILTNTYVGIQSVDADAVEAARGMGMRERQILTRLEVPLAAPLMMTGIRTATLQVIATATLAALIGGGGLGNFIVDGFAQGDTAMTIAGAMLVASLAVAVDFLLSLAERAVTPKTESGSRPRARIPLAALRRSARPQAEGAPYVPPTLPH
ncbi:MAG TPA: ABC transporter permease [Actinomycetota bacterium]|nr:ABC transporter permease [Actinomycetota bacterium]